MGRNGVPVWVRAVPSELVVLVAGWWLLGHRAAMHIGAGPPGSSVAEERQQHEHPPPGVAVGPHVTCEGNEVQSCAVFPVTTGWRGKRTGHHCLPVQLGGRVPRATSTEISPVVCAQWQGFQLSGVNIG
ncbi:UNVERIFIED_CONTAM: hypothetical protein K2H54_044246 [Gekko kuhli]